MIAADAERGAGRREEVLGVVLCGGRSRRMGRDKALLRAPDRELTLLARAAQVLGEVCDEVVLACGATPRYGELGLRQVFDRIPEAGPLAGIEAALADLKEGSAARRGVLTLACDMPHVGAAHLRRLLEQARAGGLDVSLLEGTRGPEPLVGYYGASCIEVARELLDAGLRRPVALLEDERLSWNTLPVEQLPAELRGVDPTSNWNRPSDVLEGDLIDGVREDS